MIEIVEEKNVVVSLKLDPVQYIGEETDLVHIAHCSIHGVEASKEDIFTVRYIL